MKEQFVAYEIALKFKEIGFDEECFGVYINGKFQPRYKSKNTKFNPNQKMDKRNLEFCTAPLWQQAIDWFIQKDIKIIEVPNGGWGVCILKGYLFFPWDGDFINSFNTKEEAMNKAFELLEE